MKKICTKCKENKPNKDFSPDKRNKDGLTSYCRECRRNEYKNKHKTKRIENYYTNLEENRDKNRKQYTKHKERRINEGSYDKYRKTKKKNRPEYDAQFERVKREEKYGLISIYFEKDAELTKKLFNFKCFKCGKTENITIDHHYPLHLGYILSKINAVTLCNSCNVSKYRRLPENFYTFGELNVLHSMGIMDLTEEIPNIKNYKNDYY